MLDLAPALDLFAHGLHEPDGYGLRLGAEDGVVRPLPFELWLGAATDVDQRLLDRATGPVLDVGCGPGRHVHELALRGVLALGIDLSTTAVRLARERGAEACEASIFRAIPGEGSWACALLLDGNLGIGGHPQRLLERVHMLLRPGGTMLVETDAPGAESGPVQARLEGPNGASAWFAWAMVAADRLDDIAADAGLRVTGTWTDGGRWFAELR